MGRVIGLLTVQHTGTTLVRKMFHRAGFVESDPGTECDAEYVLHFGHTCFDGPRTELILKSGIPLVTTSRNLLDTLESWSRRGKPLSGFLEQYKVWRDRVLPRALVIPIDSTDRDFRLTKVSRELGVKLETNWTPENLGAVNGVR